MSMVLEMPSLARIIKSENLSSMLFITTYKIWTNVQNTNRIYSIYQFTIVVTLELQMFVIDYLQPPSRPL